MRFAAVSLLFVVTATAPASGQVVCNASAVPKTVSAFSLSEAVGDLLIHCQRTGVVGSPANQAVQAMLSVSLNVYIGQGPLAILVVNENNCAAPAAGGGTYGSCGAPNGNVQDPQFGVEAAINRLEWSFDFPVPQTSEDVTTLRITGLRANAAQFGVSGGTVTAYVANGAAHTNNNVLNVAHAVTTPLPEPARLGTFTDGVWFLDRNRNFLFDPATEMSGWGSPGDIAVRGDWNGDGFDNLGVFSNGVWFLDLNGDGIFDPATEMKGWGVAGWLPVVGDWNGDGKTNLGVIAPATMAWFRDMNGDFVFDPNTELVGWGSPGDTPVVGDWNGDGADDMGVFSGGLWFIDLNGDGAFDPATEMKGWGVAGWLPVVGDWNGDGRAKLGAVDPATMAWFQDLNGDFEFDPATEILGWGPPDSKPVVADWDGDGIDDIGAVDGGIWLADINGNRIFDPATEYKGWGLPGWTPLPGAWQ